MKISETFQLKKCSDFKPPNCGDFEPYNEDYNCVKVEDNCALRSCENYNKPNCGQFIPKDVTNKCDTNPNDPDGTKCNLMKKKCEEIPYDYCSWLDEIEGEDGEIFECFNKANKSGCESKSCKSQSTAKCKEFIP